MTLRPLSPALALVAPLALALALLVPVAAAHVTKTTGEYSLKVGWQREPPATQERNAITLQVWKTATQEGTTNLADALSVTVSFAGSSKPLKITESDEAPGNYSTPIYLTSAGVYKIHVDGRVGSNQVSQDFQIEDVKDISDDAFPTQGSGVSNADLQREVQLLRDDVDKLKQTQSNRVPGFEMAGALVAVAAIALMLRRSP